MKRKKEKNLSFFKIEKNYDFYMNLLDKKIKNLTFEEAFERLNRVVDLIDDGNISLDDSIKYYEIGILLKDHCEQKLKDAELKIKKVVEDKIEKIDEDDLQ